jgi:Fe-S-cluster containining protein
VQNEKTRRRVEVSGGLEPFYNQRQASGTIREILERECQRCGACCISHSQRPFSITVAPENEIPKRLIQVGPKRGDMRAPRNLYVRITRLRQKLPAPVQPAESRVLALTRDTPRKQLMKCAALTGRAGEAVACSIYEARPDCCSYYDPGSPACLASREWMNLDPPADLMHLGRS